MKIAKKTLFASIIAISSLVGVVYAALLLTQTFPAVTIPSTPAITITSACSPGTSGTGALVLESTPTVDSGTLIFDCGPAGSSTPTPALSVSIASFLTSVPATPTFTIVTSPATGPSVTLALGTPGSPFGTCSFQAEAPLTSGSPISLTTASFDYCLAYSGFSTSGGSITSFTITWAS